MREEVNKNKFLLGTWSMLSSANVIDVIGSTGLDFVILDMEHGSMSKETVEHSIRSAQARKIFSLIRTQNHNESEILRVLELSPSGIMVPHIESAELAEKVVSMCRYAPHGVRGLSPYTRVHSFDHEMIEESMLAANQELCVGILIEGGLGLNNIAEICSVSGLDLVYLGIYDICQSLGLPGQLNHSSVISRLKSCIDIINKSGKIAGMFVRDAKTAQLYIDMGVKFIAYVADSYALKSYYVNAVNEVRLKNDLAISLDF